MNASTPKQQDQLAERVRSAIGVRRNIVEKRMFGGIAFMVRGHMAFGVVHGKLMVRVGPALYDNALAEPHVAPMDFTGRPMRGMVFVRPAGIASPTALRRWLRRGMDYVDTLPRKSTAAPRSRRT